MPTKHPRINIVVEKTLFNAVQKLAEEDQVSLSLKARDLIKEALLYREDLELLRLAKQRIKRFHPSKALTHDHVWRKIKKRK